MVVRSKCMCTSSCAVMTICELAHLKAVTKLYNSQLIRSCWIITTNWGYSEYKLKLYLIYYTSYIQNLKSKGLLWGYELEDVRTSRPAKIEQEHLNKWFDKRHIWCEYYLFCSITIFLIIFFRTIMVMIVCICDKKCARRLFPFVWINQIWWMFDEHLRRTALQPCNIALHDDTLRRF